MSDKKHLSTLRQHILNKRKGTVTTPFNAAMGDTLKLTSWTRDRMPDYLWLGLIAHSGGRQESLEKATVILHEISQITKELAIPRFSAILALPDPTQRRIYEIILKYIDASVLAPLTIIYRSREFPIFNEFFYCTELTLNDRLTVLSNAVREFSPHQSHAATDLRYLAVCSLVFGDKLHVASSMTTGAQALKEYASTDHTEEKMRSYRPSIRSMEGVTSAMEGHSNNSTQIFWRTIGMITACNGMILQFAENPNGYTDLIASYRDTLRITFLQNKELSLDSPRFDVIMGSVVYALKLFAEIAEKDLGNSILGRHAVRTLVEILIILKYLLKKETDEPQIWENYKVYGISKYKLVLLKARETEARPSSHFVPAIAEVLVNEIRWEEFIDIDLKYFDQVGIREKSIEAGEKELYDLLYDYDSSFAHGLWGSIRESAMLHCSNPNHRYHSVPDINSEQFLPDVKSDCAMVLEKLLRILTESYPTSSSPSETEPTK